MAVCLNAKVYKAQIEPVDTLTISSEATGKIVKLDKSKELSYQSGTIIKIDSNLDQIKLSNLRNKHSLLKEQIAIKDRNYQSIKQIRAKGKIEKDNYKVEVINYKSQERDLINTIETLKDTIDKKNIKISELFIKEFLVSQGEFVAVGTPLLNAEDHSAAKIVIYVDKNDLKDIETKKVFINDTLKHNYKVSKVSRNVDKTFISSYKVELINHKQIDTFGNVVKVEIK
jgi:multidrug resistance efflux pump